jgi:hypothetical protein
MAWCTVHAKRILEHWMLGLYWRICWEDVLWCSISEREHAVS